VNPSRVVTAKPRMNVLRVVMHVKCLHKFCSLLSYIPIYLYVIRCYIHICFEFFLNSAEQDTEFSGVYPQIPESLAKFPDPHSKSEAHGPASRLGWSGDLVSGLGRPDSLVYKGRSFRTGDPQHSSLVWFPPPLFQANP
jgi:hypothetical protein